MAATMMYFNRSTRGQANEAWALYKIKSSLGPRAGPLDVTNPKLTSPSERFTGGIFTLVNLKTLVLVDLRLTLENGIAPQKPYLVLVSCQRKRYTL